MGSKPSKEDTTGQRGKEDNSVKKSSRRKKVNRDHSNRINLQSLGGLESNQNIDRVLSDMGVRNSTTMDSESGEYCCFV